ncbi:nicC [Symbiodinium natans]|uniref:NicC protein n=1 Tax=Symbiodinium natans TaxID=878477 RepID=A0A812MLS4_9DINO|nr:nicC [Symbiodinium natans]
MSLTISVLAQVLTSHPPPEQHRGVALMAERPETSEPLRVAIIGAGLGGLTLAKALQTEATAKKVQVRLYEAWDEWKVRGGSLGLAAGARILQRLGLGKELDAVSNQGQRMNYLAQGKKLSSLAVPGYFAMRTDLQRIVVESLPADTIKLGHKLVDIAESEEGVQLSFENGATDFADVVVASDGIHSFVRQKIFGADEPVFTGFRVLYSVSSKPIRPDPTVANMHWVETAGTGYAILDVTAGQGEGRHDICLIVLGSQEPVSDRWDSAIVRERFAELAKNAAPDHEVLARAVESADVCFDWGIYQQPTRPSWISAKGRVVLLGDAAHATAPFMGQGANMAMHDAWCLSRVLLHQELSLQESLRLYEVTRKAYCENVVSASSKIGQMHTATGLKALGRNYLLKPLLFRNLRNAFGVDPTERNPWEPEPSFFQRLGLRLRALCA